MAPLHCGGFRAAGAEIAGTSGGMPVGVDSRIKGKVRKGATCDARRRDGEMFSAQWRQAFYRRFRSVYRHNSTYSLPRCVRPWFRCSDVWASQVAPLHCGGFCAAGAEIAGTSGGMPAGWTRVSRVKYVGAPLVTPVAGTAKCFPRGGGGPFIVVFAVPTAAICLISCLVASTRGSDVPACGRHKWRSYAAAVFVRRKE